MLCLAAAFEQHAQKPAVLMGEDDTKGGRSLPPAGTRLLLLLLAPPG